MTSETPILEQIKFYCDDPRFLRRVFMLSAKKLKENIKDPIEKIAAEEFGSFSGRLEKTEFQDPSLTRHLTLCRKVASLLIGEEGELQLDLLPKILNELKRHAYSLGPGWEEDAPRQEHMMRALELLQENKQLQRLIKGISRPSSHKGVEQVIRDTLLLSENTSVTDAFARRAVLSAWICQLRQSVGSCFGTAPAILVQREQPEQFLKDMDELLATGQLKRVAGGIEYSVPFPLSWGAGDLRKPIALHDEIREILGQSPGMLAALEAAGAVNGEESLKKRVSEAQKRIDEVLDLEAKFITAEELLKTILLKKCGITEKDIKEYLERPKAMLHTGLMMSAPSGGGMGGKGEACSLYFNLFAKAKNAFKSIQENALLKSWEFTFASFAETKPGFTRWNMYSSLGFNPEEPGGIGACLYREIKEKLDRANQKMLEVQQDYEMLYSQLKMVESRMRNPSSEKESQWLRIDYESKRNEFYTMQEIRDKLHFQAGRYANLLNELLDAYDELFPRYFQEVYDPDMHEVSVGPYEDSPAGFRLLYKHGRANTSMWTMIYTPQEFIESLSSFFVATEPELVGREEFQGLQQDLSELITHIVGHVRSEEFLLTSFDRMARAHQSPLIKNPLENLDKVEKKPWAYTSGGTMSNLISCYFKLDRKPFETERWVENEMELLLYFVDLIKQMPAKLQEEVCASNGRSFLMHSPTHAFALTPSFPEFGEAVRQEIFTYTYVRDQLLKPQQRVIDFLFLDKEAMDYLIELFSEKVPPHLKQPFLNLKNEFFGQKSPPEFRSALVHLLELDQKLSRVLVRDQIDSCLYEWLPLVPLNEIRGRMENILYKLPGIKDVRHALEKAVEAIVSMRGNAPFITAKQLQDLCKAALILAFNATSLPTNYAEWIAKKAHELGYAVAFSMRFADTNWNKDYFAFVVNPGTGSLDLWRLNRQGSRGFPMSSWREWLNGSRKDRTWGVYTKLHEYRLT